MRRRLLAFAPDNRSLFSGRPFSFTEALRHSSDEIDVVPVRLGGHEEFRRQQLQYVIRRGSWRMSRGYALSSEYMTAAWNRADVAIRSQDVVLVFHPIAPKPVVEAARAGLCTLICYIDMCLTFYFREYEVTASIPAKLKRALISQESETLHACSRIFTLGDNAADFIARTFELDRSRLLPIGRGSNFTAEEQLAIRRARADGLPDREMNVVFNGVDAKRKGLHDAIEAIDQLAADQRARVRLHVIGPDKSAIPERDYIVAHGFIDRDREPERFNAALSMATCGILLSQAEGVPGSLFEFLACGIPVISTDLPPIVNAIRNRAVTFVSASDVVPQTRDALTELLENDATLSRMRQQARRDMDEFNWGLVAQRLINAWPITSPPDAR